MRSRARLVTAAARRWQRSPSQAGWSAALVIGPHLVLGTWLLMVPDHLAFTAAQIVTLVHVALAVITFPLVGALIVAHALRMRSATPGSLRSRAINWTLSSAVAVACVTGFFAIWGGTIVAPSSVHAICGVAVAVPLAVHFWSAARKGAAAIVVGLLLLSTAGGEAARRWLPPAPVEAVTPAFEYTTRSADLYEPAANCGECHVQDYADWKRSTHARTLSLENVRESLARSPDLLDKNLGHIGRMLRDESRPLSASLLPGACGSCHAPTSFYGDDPTPLLHPSGVVAEGTGCSFCHTLRAVRENRSPMPPIDPQSLSRADIAAVMSRAPFFVSAPQTVRRYLFQGTTSPLGRRISNWLIRWRPEVHRRDYHSPMLDDSRACLACHSLGLDAPEVPHMTYSAWEKSSFNTGDPKTTVECQDCHMVRHMTGQPVSEPAREVPWGPLRAGARSHLFLGGNVQAAEAHHDTELARLEHELSSQAMSVSLSSVERDGDMLRVTVTVRSDLVGHTFPALETQLRYGWVQLKVLDAGGGLIAMTPPPRDSQDYGSASPLIMASTDDPKPDNSRLIGPRGSRELKTRLALPPGARVDRIVAELHLSLDGTAIATTFRSL